MSAAARPSRNRPARAPVLPLSALETFEALDRTHSEVLHQLRQLELLVKRLESDADAPELRTIARAACAFFDRHAREHHAEEERVVFPPLLASRDAELVQAVQRLQQDHGWLEEDWIEIRPLLATLADGTGSIERETLEQYLATFGSLYLEHIALEESLVYPEAKRLAAADAESAGLRGRNSR